MKALDDFRLEVAELEPTEVECLELECRLQAVLNGIGRACMAEAFARADTEVASLEYQGERWGNRRVSMGNYESVFGPVKLARSIYSKGGGGRVLVPLEVRLGIVEGRYTPKMGRIATRAKALMTSAESAEMLKEIGVAQVSESTFDRLPKAIAARYEQHRDTINAAIRETETVPNAAVVVQVGMDGVMVPQDGEHAKPRGRKTETPAEPRHERRYGVPDESATPAEADGQSGLAWHEATVGTLSYWDEDGNLLKTTYIGRMPESGQGTVASDLEQELHVALDQRPDLSVGFASDGDAHQWRLLEALAGPVSQAPRRRIRFLLDFFHAAIYVHDAAEAVLDASAAKVQAEQWKATLKEYENGADRVLKSMRYYRDRESRTARREVIEKSIDFLANQARAGRMNYKEAIDSNHPIGTGTTEAAAKTLVSVRMKRAGARYDQHGGQTILTFRAHLLSERFETLWAKIDETYRGVIREAA